jgi:hypothetical protein
VEEELWDVRLLLEVREEELELREVLLLPPQSTGHSRAGSQHFQEPLGQQTVFWLPQSGRIFALQPKEAL